MSRDCLAISSNPPLSTAGEEPREVQSSPPERPGAAPGWAMALDRRLTLGRRGVGCWRKKKRRPSQRTTRAIDRGGRRAVFSPQMMGRYEITERIAQGGMAEIYKARSLGADGFAKTVVIKRILPEYTQDADFVAMFVHEAKLATQLDHPNIVQVFDLGKVGDEYFITMEYVDGPNLHAAAVRAFKNGLRPFPLRECLFVVAEACNGLDYAHRKTGHDGQPLGIIHRDISPPNILVSFDGSVKVADFGVAKARDQGVRTRTGVLKGKFGYMSPEQASGAAIDRRSDVFSLGVVLWELLAGKRLFKGPTPLQTVERVIRCEIPLLCSYTPDMPPEVDAIVQKALAKDSAQRYQDCGEFAEAINEYLFAAALKVSARDLSAFLRHLFLDERTPAGEPVWRPSPLPPPLRKSARPPSSVLTDAGDGRTEITDIAIWEEIGGSSHGEPVWEGESTGATRSAKYRGGTLLEFNAVAGESAEAPSRTAVTILGSRVSGQSNVLGSAEAPRMTGAVPTIPVHVTDVQPSSQAPFTAGGFHQAVSIPVSHAGPAPRAPQPLSHANSAKLPSAASPTSPAVHAIGATTAPVPARPTPPTSGLMSQVWWTLGGLALAGAMAALIYFSKR